MWTTIERCAKILGLQFNQSKTGSAYLTNDTHKDPEVQDVLTKGKVILGFLELEAQSGKWVIDHKQVDAHIKQVGKQLAGCTSVFSWIQIGTAVSDVSSITLLGGRRIVLANVMWT